MATPVGQPWPTARPRPWWKTILFGLLLLLIPLVGSGIAVIYVHTRNEPDAFSFGAALGSTAILLASVVGAFIVVVVVVAVLD